MVFYLLWMHSGDTLCSSEVYGPIEETGFVQVKMSEKLWILSKCKTYAFSLEVVFAFPVVVTFSNMPFKSQRRIPVVKILAAEHIFYTENIKAGIIVLYTK